MVCAVAGTPFVKPSHRVVFGALWALLLLLLVAVTSACGSESSAGPSSSSSPASAAVTAGATTAPSTEGSATTATAYPTVTLARGVTATFTDAQVQDAYQAVADYTVAVGWQPDLMHTTGSAATPAALAPIAALMTSTCAADFNAIATRASTGSQVDINTIEGIALVNVHSPDASTLAPGDAAASDRTITAASASLDPNNPTRLAITLTATAQVHFVDGATKAQSLTTRHITYDLIPGTGSTPWLIDAWNGTVESTVAQPED